jgi:hypothetical protein
MTILPWVRPYRGRRDMDPAGSGVFGASRDRGGRKHLGLDLISVPGDEVVSPIFGVITKIGWAYADGKLGSIHIKGSGQHDGAEVKLLYVSASVHVGDILKAGDPIGTAQDVAGYYDAKDVHGMTNHVHGELKLIVDPGGYLPFLNVSPDLTT